ncbi:restriction endonuclease subunit S [Candidatus Kuenenia sp.]|uniref:restriction endonuclease subunit S n=1 Tax=Candidatus Kuenenia sp. TaxID=2499824 RepID=UPI0032204121
MGEWKTVKLAEVLLHRKGYIIINNDEEYSLCRVQLHRRGVVLREKKMGYQIKTKKQQVCKAGDLIVAEMDAKFGGYGFIPNHLEGAIVSSHYYLYELDKNKITQEYFEILIKTDFIQNQIEAKGSTNYSSIRAWEFLDYEIPLFSITLQNIIATKYSKHSRFREDFGIELNAQLNYLSQLRQAVLREAIKGKLTAEWRKQNPKLICGYNHASKLLEKIKVEKERLIKEDRIKKDKPIVPISDAEKPFNLPAGWAWCRLGEVSINKDEYREPIAQSIRERKEKIYDYYGASGIIDKIDGYTHEGKNLLIGEDGANLVARSTPVAFIADGKYWVNNHAHVLGLLDDTTLFFIKSYINAIDLMPYITGGFQPKLSQANLLIIPVPFPSLAEQQAIVERVDMLMSMVDELEKQVSERKKQSEMLMQSVLREAFAKG